MKTIVAVLSLKEYESEVLKRKNSNNNSNNQQAVKRKRWQIRPQKHIVPWRLLVVCRRQKWVTTALYRFKRPKANNCFRRSCDYLYKMLRPWILCRKREKPVVHKKKSQTAIQHQNVQNSRSDKTVDRRMVWFRLKEDTSGLGPWSMTHQLFFCPKRIKMRDMLFCGGRNCSVINNGHSRNLCLVCHRNDVCSDSRSINASFLFRLWYFLIFLSFFLLFFCNCLKKV